MISIVNYGMGNIGSIVNMFKRVGVACEIVSTAQEIEKAKKLVLPGVGAFDAAMIKINELGLKNALDQKALYEKIPVLGICLGMQLLTESSEEGKLSGLGWIKAKTLSFKKVIDTNIYKVPHMGWNTVRTQQKSALVEGFENLEETRFYFVHSYYVKCSDSANSLFKAEYGIEFDAAICSNNIFGTQFHPEKSHKFGMKLFENFSKI